jgi:SNF2 family DNA or RNA helicase
LKTLKKIKNSHTDSGSSQICRLTDKFNIFKIKWNRIILDEAHENLTPVVKLFTTSVKQYINGTSGVRIHTEDQFLFENLCVINSNYKWAMTGTPAKNGIDNIMGMLEFLTKKNYEEPLLAKIEKIRYLSDIVGITKQYMNPLLKNIFKKTLKKDVKAILNIPIFTEEIIYVEQTNIERNIYNTIRCSRHFTETVRMRRLFLMCTNILINEGYDLDNNNEIVTTEALTLEQLNANMITKFNQQLVQLEQNKTRTLQTIETLALHNLDWVNLTNYINNHNNNVPIFDRLNPEVEQELKDKFEDLERPIVKSQCEIFYNLLNVFELWKDPTNISHMFMENIIMIKNHLFRIWKPTWMAENVMFKCAGYGSKLGEIKIKEDIAKKNKQLETIANDKKRINNQIALFSNNEFLKEKTSDPCIICFEPLTDVVVTPCRHIFCLNCTKHMSNELKANFTCPECRSPLTCNTLNITSVDMILKKSETVEVVHKISSAIDNKDLTELEKKLGADWKNNCINKYGSKMFQMVQYLYTIFEHKGNRAIIFSQYEKMLKLISITLEEFKIKFVHCTGNNYVLNRNINKFKTDDSYRVILLSAESANSGANLTEASHVILIDVLQHDIEKTKAIENQIIGRVVRLGQQKNTKIIRFITKGTVEEEHFNKNRYDINILQN